jgi:hypothetical protein
MNIVRNRKLSLTRTAIRSLTGTRLAAAVGGSDTKSQLRDPQTNGANCNSYARQLCRPEGPA